MGKSLSTAIGRNAEYVTYAFAQTGVEYLGAERPPKLPNRKLTGYDVSGLRALAEKVHVSDCASNH